MKTDKKGALRLQTHLLLDRPAIDWPWQDLTMMLPSRLGCPLNLKTANMGKSRIRERRHETRKACHSNNSHRGHSAVGRGRGRTGRRQSGPGLGVRSNAHARTCGCAQPAAPTPAPIKLPDPPDKLQPVAPSTERSTTGTRSEPAAPGQGTAYTWEDGDRTLKVVLQDGLVVQKTADNTPADEVVAKGATDSIVRKQAKHGRDVRPVFRSESGGGLMTLPGGVLLALDPEWDQDAVDKFFSSNNISADRRSELGFIPNASW